jgi:glycosyltransferase involved in cell wall biosynthesis
VTVSELVETFLLWSHWKNQLNGSFKKIKLFTMFETTDVHPGIIKSMKIFDEVVVPYDYLKEILVKHGVNAVSLNWYTSDLIRMKPFVVPKAMDKERKIFLYVGTNDKRKNVTTLTKVFAKAAEGTNHLLIVKTNKEDELTQTKNIQIITEKIPLERLASLYNLCDYVISFTRGEGVGLPMLEANYFGKPVICQDQGVFRDVKKEVKSGWITLPSKEIPIDLEGVPEFLHEVFYGTWFDVSEDSALDIIKNIMLQ